MRGQRAIRWQMMAFAGAMAAGVALVTAVALTPAASAQGNPNVLANRVGCDTDGDGRADVWLTNTGFAVDIGQGHALAYDSKAVGIKQTARNQCVVVYDSDGNGTLDTQLTLTDKNGDGDFGDDGEMMRSAYPPRAGR